MTHASASPQFASPASLPEWASQAINLADPRIGARALSCSDDFFAPMARMLQPNLATFVPGKYDDHGKWMDGWESRRKRGPGHDWCVIQLGVPGRIQGVDIDTSFFTGNYPPAASIEGCQLADDPADPKSWQSLLPITALQGNSHHLLPIVDTPAIWSHLRLNLFPDGGVARLRVYGQAHAQEAKGRGDGLIDLVAMVHGGRALAWNDAHFGACANLLLPGRGQDMGEGWETRRRREPGHDWCILALGLPGIVSRVEVDTAHFKGNFPHSCSLQGARIDATPQASLIAQSQFWPTLLAPTALQADAVGEWACEALGPITHVRLNLHPDGGVSRLRLWGQPT